MAAAYLFNQQLLAGLGVAPGPAFVERPRALQDDDLPHAPRESQQSLRASGLPSCTLPLPPLPLPPLLLLPNYRRTLSSQRMDCLKLRKGGPKLPSQAWE